MRCAKWPELFRGRDVLVRIDTGFGRGHHDHVRTAGVHAKFGVPLFELDELAAPRRRQSARAWSACTRTPAAACSTCATGRRSGQLLGDLAQRFPHVRVIDLGGGLGVPEKPGQVPVDLAALQAVIDDMRARWPKLALWLEPGRFLVAQRPACCSRRSRSSRARAPCSTSASRPA